MSILITEAKKICRFYAVHCHFSVEDSPAFDFNFLNRFFMQKGMHIFGIWVR